MQVQIVLVLLVELQQHKDAQFRFCRLSASKEIDSRVSSHAI